MTFDDPTCQRAADEGAALKLLVVGEATVQSIPLPARGTVVMGRARECDVTITDDSVSRRHARLHVAPLRLEDMGSANGTRVGARALAAGEAVGLAPGDAFTLGSVTLFVQRAKSHAAPMEVRTDGYFDARLLAECARAQRYGLRFALVSLSIAGGSSSMEAAVRAEARAADVVGISAAGEARVLLLYATREIVDAFVDAVRARLREAGECEVGVASCPDDGFDPGKLLAATRARARARSAGSAPEAMEPVAVDPSSVALRDRVGRLAASDLPALFVGEEGVGKRLLAATLHARSRHARRALVRVSCEAVSDAVLEAALFGADGADGRSGALEAADGGALLLEHVEALPTSLEPRLTHALEYGQTYRVGSTTPRRVHVRLVATARHRQTSFVERVLVGRLASVVVDVPPLRARTGDVEALARGFAGARELAPEAIEALRAHPWPGNVRELRATVERTLHTATARVVGAEDLDLPPLPTTPPPALRAEVERLERERIEAALAAHGGNRSRAARALGIARNTLLTRLRSYGL